MAKNLTVLKHIHLGGCPKVSEAGIIEILDNNIAGLEEMAIEGISPVFVSSTAVVLYISIIDFLLGYEGAERILYTNSGASSIAFCHFDLPCHYYGGYLARRCGSPSYGLSDSTLPPSRNG